MLLIQSHKISIASRSVKNFVDVPFSAGKNRFGSLAHTATTDAVNFVLMGRALCVRATLDFRNELHYEIP